MSENPTTVLHELVASATPELQARLKTESLEALQMMRDASGHSAELRSPRGEALKAALSPDLYEVHRQAMIALEREYELIADLHIAELRRHLPSLSAAIGLVWHHVLEMRPGDEGVCCMGGTR